MSVSLKVQILGPWESNSSTDLRLINESGCYAFFADLDEIHPTKDVALDIFDGTINLRSFLVFRDDDIFVQD